MIRHALSFSGEARAQNVSAIRRQLADVLTNSHDRTVSDVDELYCLGVQLRSVWDRSLPIIEAEF